MVINRALSRPQKNRRQGYPPEAFNIGDFDFPTKRQQADTAIACGHGVGNITGQCGHITYLRATDNTATLHQAGTVSNDGFILDNLRVGNGTTDHNRAIFSDNLVQPADT